LVPFTFAFARLNALQAAVRHSTSLSDPVLRLVTQANNLIVFYNIYWASSEAMKRKRLNAMPALLKFLVLLALFLSASNSNAFTSFSSVAGNQVRINHLTQLQQQMNDPTNEQSRKPIRKPTKQLEQDALLPVNLSSKGGLCHDKKSE
jgi:hypothetical protein